MEELKDLREKIDAIDQQMVDLFKQRMEVSKEVAAYKQANGLPTLDAGRERALLGKVGEAGRGGAGRLHPVGCTAPSWPPDAPTRTPAPV